MKKVTISKAEFEMMAEKNCLPLDPDVAENARLMFEEWINDFHDVMEEMMQPEYDDIFPASIVSL